MTDDELIKAAQNARFRAYAPYSRFSVGAALLMTDGQIFTGANIENLSFGLTICAERVAIGCAVQAGSMGISRLAIAAESELPVVPCGACRQVLAEFNPTLHIISSTLSGITEEFDLAILLPISRQGILR